MVPGVVDSTRGLPVADGRIVPKGLFAEPRLELPPPAMYEPVTNDVLHQLDQQHEQLLWELDSLNERLEQALNSFGKQSESVEPAAK